MNNTSRLVRNSKIFKTGDEAHKFAQSVNGEVITNVACRWYVVEWDVIETENKLPFDDMWEHYRVQYKDSNNSTIEIYSIEALGFLKALRLLYPDHIKELNKEIAVVLSELMIKVLGDEK